MADPRHGAADLPQFQKAAELRAARSRPRGLRRRAIAVGALVTGLVASIVAPPRPRLVWNTSASAPVGLYAVGDRDGIEAGDMVIAWVPRRARALAAARHYLPANVPLVKRVAAAPGDTICAANDHIRVNGRWVAWRRSRDGRGRPMPAWRGCITLGEGALFLLMADSADSFDGRYFGPTSRGDVIGKAALLWAR